MFRKLLMMGLALLTLQVMGSMNYNISSLHKFTALNAISYQINQFSLELYKAVAESKDEDMVCSPMSVWTVLSMASNGAEGSTARQLKSALHLYFDIYYQRLGVEHLLEKLNTLKKVHLTLANKIFIASNLNLKLEFQEVTAHTFKSAAQSVDFSKSEETSKIINNWVDQQTNSRIQDIVDPDDLNKDTGLVLINAVYFKGKWANPFIASETSPEPFHLRNGNVKNVPMMRKVGNYRVGLLREMSAQFIELPYESESDWDAISMFVIIPDTIADFKTVEKKIENLHISRLMSGTMTEVDLLFPKFKVESEIDLKLSLIKLGLTEIFEDTAIFSGIVDTPMLKVSKIVQKAFIEVNEEGSEAAAATGIEIGNRFGSDDLPFKVIHVNRPFIVMICTQDIALFTARIVNPNF